MINMIWAQDLNGAIGFNNKLLFPLPEDLKYFAGKTRGSIVVMGRLTWDSLPEKNKPLPNRLNIILTRNGMSIDEPNVEVFSDFQDIVDEYGNSERDIWLIGGSQIYNSLLKYVDYLFITQINEHAEKADVFAPSQNDIEANFKLTEQSELLYSVYKGIPYQFKIFERE